MKIGVDSPKDIIYVAKYILVLIIRLSTSLNGVFSIFTIDV